VRVNVIGQGLSALLAAHAATLYGHDVRMVDMDREPRADGIDSLALFRRIPDLHTAPMPIRSLVVGDELAWSGKAGPMVAELPVQGELYGWSAHELYEELDDRYSDLPRIKTQDPREALSAELPICAENLTRLCHFSSCQFKFREVDQLPISKFTAAGVDNYLVGSGIADDWWHTAWSLGGVVGSYVPATGTGYRRPLAGAVRLRVPTQTTCACRPGVLRVGKLGKWDARVQASDAFFDTIRRLQEIS
jgi:hypothetical protein